LIQPFSRQYHFAPPCSRADSLVLTTRSGVRLPGAGIADDVEEARMKRRAEGAVFRGFGEHEGLWPLVA
jgi:hypothetical protein